FIEYTPTPATSTLSLHDALPILDPALVHGGDPVEDLDGRRDRDEERDRAEDRAGEHRLPAREHVVTPHEEAEQRDGEAGESDELDRKSTRLNSSHVKISYAVFCL